MTGKDQNPEQTTRQRAEARLLKRGALAPENAATLSPEATAKLLHELQAHQIELEMQNEELRESHVALESVRARYFDLYDLAPVGYCTVSEGGIIMQANLTAAGLLGLTRRELVHQPLTRFICKEDEDRYYLQRKQLMATGEAQSFELRMKRKDGTLLWVRLEITSAQNAEGAFELRAVLSDITERELAEDARRKSESRVSGLMGAMLEATIMVDADFHITLFNPAAERMFGVSAGEVLGSGLDRLIPTRFLPADFDQMLRHGQGNFGAHQLGKAGEMFGLHSDGREFPVDASIAQLEVNGEKMFTVMLRDVSEREHLYQMLQERNLALESATALAEKANRAKSDFLSSMSHELRTPLNAILGFAQLMEAGTPAPTDSQQRSLERILKAGWYLLELINEILDLAKVESGKVMLSNEAVGLADVVLECRAMAESEALKCGIGMTFPRFDGPCFVLADRTRLTQVLANLLSNAIKYNRPGGTVLVECARVAPELLRISVRDTGIGMSPAQLAQLFQPFNRLGKEAGPVEGTGIGLVVTKRLVELMGGTMGVESTVGAGSRFWIDLTVTTAPELEPLLLAQVVPARPLVPEGAPRHTLLYVEDNPANLELVKQIIERRPDLRLITATDGSRGIDLVRSQQPEVVLMDINLPGISGIDAMKILQADPITRHIPIIAISANAMPHDIERALAVGFFSYLTKPIRVNELVESLDVALEMAQLRAAQATPPSGA